jgi:DNA-cytosine methyltransferase
MNVLSLFDGISCGQIALNRAGISYDNYYASEVDAHAIAVAQKNYPGTVQVGDVIKLKGRDFPKIDLLIGGSPCQGFSFAGRQLNFNDPRSRLFFEFVRILNETKPKHFILENVKMKKEYRDVISEHLGVQPIEINSALVSAQNRRRLYWTNIPGVTQPLDKKILLKDVVEKGVSEKDRSFCIGEANWKGTGIEECLKKNIRLVAFTERRTDEAKKIRREFQQKHGRDFSPRRAKEMTARSDGKMNCLTATFSTKEHTLIDENGYYRKVTPLECERLQTVPVGYTECASTSQRYKMLGNGWTVDVIAHIINFIKLTK